MFSNECKIYFYRLLQRFWEGDMIILCNRTIDVLKTYKIIVHFAYIIISLYYNRRHYNSNKISISPNHHIVLHCYLLNMVRAIGRNLMFNNRV